MRCSSQPHPFCLLRPRTGLVGFENPFACSSAVPQLFAHLLHSWHTQVSLNLKKTAKQLDAEAAAAAWRGWEGEGSQGTAPSSTTTVFRLLAVISQVCACGSMPRWAG